MNPYYESENGTLYHGDCLDIMKTMPSNCIDTVLTDPPYGLGEIKNLAEVLSDWLAGGDMSANKKDFMGKDWELPSPVIWREVFRILKPGGSALVFAGTRSFDLMAISMRLAGFEIKDSIWHGYSSFIGYCYGSGFPKSHNIGKSVSKINKEVREVIGSTVTKDIRRSVAKDIESGKTDRQGKFAPGSPTQYMEHIITKGTSEWEGYGSALKPAIEPILLAMKPNDGTYAENALKWGVAGINVDGCRIGTNETITNHSRSNLSAISKGIYGDSSKQVTHQTYSQTQGRFPSNLLLSHHPECVCEGESMIASNERKDKGTCKGVFGDRGKVNSKQWQTEQPEGKETIEKWVCHPDCIVGQMNQRAGVKHKPGNKKEIYNRKEKDFFFNLKPQNRNPDIHSDQGGYVSRYFKQRRESNTLKNSINSLNLSH